MKKRKKSIVIGMIVIMMIIIASIAIRVTLKAKTETTAIQNETEKEAEATEVQNQTTDFKINFLYGVSDCWDKYINNPDKTKSEFESEVLSDIDQIATYLKKDDWKNQYQKDGNAITIKLTITEEHPEPRDYISYSVESGVPTFNVTYGLGMFSSWDLPLTNTLTHIITFDHDKQCSSFSKSLEYGLGEYIHNTLGKELNQNGRVQKAVQACNHGINVHKILNDLNNMYTKDDWAKKNYNVDVDYIASTMGTATGTIPYSLQEIQGKYWLLSSYSFVDYLIQTYGVDKVMSVFNGQNESVYNSINNNGLSGLISDWKKFLAEYPAMTSEEIRSYTISSEVFSEGYRENNGYYDLKEKQ